MITDALNRFLTDVEHPPPYTYDRETGRVIDKNGGSVTHHNVKGRVFEPEEETYHDLMQAMVDGFNMWVLHNRGIKI